MNAAPFKSFDEANNALPAFIATNPLTHKTISNLAFLVQHEIDLATEGEENDIKCQRQTDTTKRWQKCRWFLARRKATGEFLKVVQG